MENLLNLLSNVDVYQVSVWLGIVGLIAVVLTAGYLLLKVVLKESVEDGHALEQLSREQLSVKRAGTTVYLGDSWQPARSFGADVSLEGNKFSADKYRSENHNDPLIETDFYCPTCLTRVTFYAEGVCPFCGYKKPLADIEDSHELVQCQTGYIPVIQEAYPTLSEQDAAWEANHSEKGDLYDTAQ